MAAPVGAFGRGCRDQQSPVSVGTHHHQRVIQLHTPPRPEDQQGPCLLLSVPDLCHRQRRGSSAESQGGN